jgi:flavin reductase (DIM6/NTAB) family NADH-FMN oxidoreductase RutF
MRDEGNPRGDDTERSESGNPPSSLIPHLGSLPAPSSLLGLFWTPLVAVTAAAGGRRGGQIAVSVHGASIVPQRPRFTVGLWKNNFTRDLVLASGAFAVHVLRADQDDLVFHLGLQSARDVDKLATVPHDLGSTGTPLLHDCLGLFECRVLNHMDGGDHTVFLGEVVHSESRSEGAPLWWRDLRARAPADLLAAYTERNAGHIAQSLEVMDQIE